ncbi:MAG: XisI protein [Pseudanabaenales cyanobacterium]|nr:XisI protein [Pseudanabaenales cyanobacterium]
MDSTAINYQVIIQQLFNNYIEFLGETEELQLESIFDREHDRYLLVEVGWQNGRRIYGALLHIDIINDKLWIQQDGTEEGIASELVALGIPKQKIVLAFKPIERRKITEYAVS